MEIADGGVPPRRLRGRDASRNICRLGIRVDRPTAFEIRAKKRMAWKAFGRFDHIFRKA
jgi:hypothetical protein